VYTTRSAFRVKIRASNCGLWPARLIFIDWRWCYCLLQQLLWRVLDFCTAWQFRLFFILFLPQISQVTWIHCVTARITAKYLVLVIVSACLCHLLLQIISIWHLCITSSILLLKYSPTSFGTHSVQFALYTL